MSITKEQELLGSIITKAWEDEKFKEELLSNPVQAIESLTGEKIQLPEGKKLVVRDQTNESTIYINIPAKQEAGDVELTEEQLETVAGGIMEGGCIPGPFKPPFEKYPIPRLPIFTI